jgi:KaiC/GvpD/RAD55 family RecA-like ATPase
MEARTPTNIDGLDTILDGGFPRPSANLIIGPIGCGARIIVQELAVNMLKQGFAVSYYSIETTATEVRHDLARLALDVADFEKQDLLHFIDLFSKSVNNLETIFKEYQPGDSVLQSGLQFEDLIAMAKEYTLRNMKRNILEIDILDSLTPFFLLSDVKEAFHYCQNLKFASRFANTIGIGLHYTGVVDTAVETTLYNLSDGIIKLQPTQQETSGETIGHLSVLKMKGQRVSPNQHLYHIADQRITFPLHLF